MIKRSAIAIATWLAVTMAPGVVYAELVSGTVTRSTSPLYSEAVVSSDLRYNDGVAYSTSSAMLICIDVDTNLPSNGSAAFFSNSGPSTLKGNSGPKGEAAIHWLIENYYSAYHKNGTHQQSWAFQYALWEIGNDFNGNVASISATAGRANPSIDGYFGSGAAGGAHPDFVAAYQALYSGLIAALPSLDVNYRSTTYSVDLFANAVPTDQAMVIVVEQPPAIRITNVPTATVGSPFYLPVTSSSGLGPRTWSATGLPPGLSIDPTTGVISGVPAAPTTTPATVVVTVVDSSSPPLRNTRTLSLSVSTSVPTLGEYGLAMLSLLMATISAARTRRLRRA